jgi:hypothetical protein
MLVRIFFTLASVLVFIGCSSGPEQNRVPTSHQESMQLLVSTSDLLIQPKSFAEQKRKDGSTLSRYTVRSFTKEIDKKNIIQCQLDYVGNKVELSKYRAGDLIFSTDPQFDGPVVNIDGALPYKFMVSGEVHSSASTWSFQLKDNPQQRLLLTCKKSAIGPLSERFHISRNDVLKAFPSLYVAPPADAEEDPLNTKVGQ